MPASHPQASTAHIGSQNSVRLSRGSDPCWRLDGEVIRLTATNVRVQQSDGAHVDLQGADAAFENLLRSLDGKHPWNQVVRSLSVDQQATAERTRDWLAEMGLIQPMPTTADNHLALLGAGRLAAMLLTQLLRSTQVHINVGESPADEIRTALARLTPPTRRVRLGPDPLGARTTRMDVVVLCSTTIEPDRGILSRLDDSRLPYVVLMAHRDSAWMSPLIVAGRTPCWQCADMWRADEDAAWVPTLAKLSCVPARPSPGALHWLVGTFLANLPDLLAGLPGDAHRLAGSSQLCEHMWPRHSACVRCQARLARVA